MQKGKTILTLVSRPVSVRVRECVCAFVRVCMQKECWKYHFASVIHTV
jgi:hypothetical protein